MSFFDFDPSTPTYLGTTFEGRDGGGIDSNPGPIPLYMDPEPMTGPGCAIAKSPRSAPLWSPISADLAVFRPAAETPPQRRPKALFVTLLHCSGQKLVAYSSSCVSMQTLVPFHFFLLWTPTP